MKINKRQSNRMPARRRYKIEKKVRQHNKKVRRADKKNPAKKKQPVINVPNHCPFKEDILKEVEALKKQKEEERQKQRDLAKLERQKKKEESKAGKNQAAKADVPDTTKPVSVQINENTETQNVIDAADIILEVVDARDPMGTRCMQLEKAVHEDGNKRLVIVLNKADLVPKDNLMKWLKYIRKTTPAVAFKADTQYKSMRKSQHASKVEGSGPLGVNYLKAFLNNYCEKKEIEGTIRVGVVGLPYVGKSSLIWSLCASSDDIRRGGKEVRIGQHLLLLNAAGVIRATGNDSISKLRNIAVISSIEDPITTANAILERMNKKVMMCLYDIVEYATADEFCKLKAVSFGKYTKGAAPDTVGAARGLLEDWHNGKIKYYTNPPAKGTNVLVSAVFAKQVAKEFSFADYENLEREAAEGSTVLIRDTVLLKSWGMVNADVEEKMEDDSKVEEDEVGELKAKVVVAPKKVNKKKGEARMKKQDPGMEQEENPKKMNKVKKVEFKKPKNSKAKVEQRGLKSKLSKKGNDDYDFDVDHVLE